MRIDDLLLLADEKKMGRKVLMWIDDLLLLLDENGTNAIQSLSRGPDRWASPLFAARNFEHAGPTVINVHKSSRVDPDKPVRVGCPWLMMTRCLQSAISTTMSDTNHGLIELYKNVEALSSYADT